MVVFTLFKFKLIDLKTNLIYSKFLSSKFCLSFRIFSVHIVKVLYFISFKTLYVFSYLNHYIIIIKNLNKDIHVDLSKHFLMVRFENTPKK